MLCARQAVTRSGENMKTALIIIDVQKDYFPGGKYPLVNPLEAAQKAYMILQCFREHGPHGAYHVHMQHFLFPVSAAQTSTIRLRTLMGSRLFINMSPTHS